MLAGSGDALLLGAGKQPPKVGQIMTSGAVSFTTIEEAKLGILDAYSKAESFLQSLLIVTCYRMPWESFSGFGFYEGPDPPDDFKLFQSIRKKKADELQEVLHQLHSNYQQTIQAFIPLFPMLEFSCPAIGLFQQAIHARYFFEAIKVKTEDWGRQFLNVFEKDFIFPITPSRGILSHEEIFKRNQKRELENREWNRLRDTIDRLNRELPFTAEDQQLFLNRLWIEKGQLLRDLPAYFVIQGKSKKTQTPWEKRYMALLNEYLSWQPDYSKRTGDKRPSPKKWLLEKNKWTQKSKDFFKELCANKDGTEDEIIDNAIRYARKLATQET